MIAHNWVKRVFAKPKIETIKRERLAPVKGSVRLLNLDTAPYFDPVTYRAMMAFFSRLEATVDTSFDWRKEGF